VIGPILAIFSVLLLTRRQIFIGAHVLIGILLGLVGYFIDTGHPNLALASMTIFNVVFQASNGTCFWVYCADVGTDAALGLSLCTIMIVLLI
jgi:hypothetical protein